MSDDAGCRSYQEALDSAAKIELPPNSKGFVHSRLSPKLG